MSPEQPLPEIPEAPQLPQTPPDVSNLPQVASSTNSVAPNMIGDFLNSGVTGITLSTRVQAVPLNPFGPPLSTMATGQQLLDGLALTNQSGFDLGLMALDDVGTLVEAGDQTTIFSDDINPLLTRVTFQTSATLAQANAALAGGGMLPALAPISNEEIFTRVENVFRQEFPDLAENVDLREFFTLRLVPEESTLNADGAGNVTATYVYEIVFNIPTPAPGELIGRASFSDNASPVPRDRFFVDFNYFHRAQVGPANIPLNRLSIGGEKTFLDETTSIELRVPMAVTANSTVNTDGTDILNYEMGDVGVAFKALVFQGRRVFYTAGLGVTIPTADDFRVNLSNGNPFVHIRNDSVHVVPYVAALYTPNNRVFLQSFLQLDIDTNGNQVSVNEQALNGTSSTDPGTLEHVGRLQSSTLLKFDAQAGYWHFRNRRRRGRLGISGAATVLEAHLATIVSDPDRIDLSRVTLGQPPASTVLNLTIGEQLYFGPQNNVTIGYGVPVTDDRFFDGELRLFYNRFF